MREHIDSFWQQQSYAVVGVSSTGKGFGSLAYAALKNRGLDVYPVNSRADEVMGEKCFRSVGDLPQPPDAVLVVVPPPASADVVKECARLGIKHVWLQKGAESQEGVRAGEEQGLSLVHGACAMMFMPGTAFPHRAHRFFAELFGAAPR